MKLYRYYNNSSYIYLKEHKVIKETPCGYWIEEDDNWTLNDKKWVSKTSKKRFAYPSLEEAANNFILRKKRQIAILQAQVNISKNALFFFEENKKEGLFQHNYTFE